MTTVTTTTSKTTGWKTPASISQYTTNVNSGTCYAFSRLTEARVAGGSYAYIPSSGGVNSSHKGPRVYAYNYKFGLPTDGSVVITTVHIRQRVTKGTNQGGIIDSIVRLKTTSSLSNTGNGTNRGAALAWSTKSFTYRPYSYTPSAWGVSLTRELVNQSYFGCLVQCTGSSSTWATPWLDSIEMKIDYNHSITTTINPTYSQTQTLSTSTVKVNGQKTNLTIVQKNTNNATGTFPVTTVTLSSGLYFSDGTQSKTIAGLSTGEGWSRTTTYTNIYCTTAGTGTITITNSIIGTKTLNVTKLAADVVIPDPAYDIKVTATLKKKTPNNYQSYVPGEKAYLEIITTGKAYTSEPITDINVEMPNIAMTGLSHEIINNYTLATVAKHQSQVDISVSTNHATTTTAFTFTNTTRLNFSIPDNYGDNKIYVTYTVGGREYSLTILYTVKIEYVECIADNNYKITNEHKVSILLGDTLTANGCKMNIFSECKAETDTEKPFIGVVNISQGHSIENLTNTTKNTLIEEGYKNRVNIGKKGDYIETLPLSVIVDREDAATFQGMVDMDKPFPINTVLQAGDLDPLNHRGWVEIHECNISHLNPLKSRVELEMRYISRNLSVPTYITRNARLNSTINATLPDIRLQQFDIDYTDIQTATNDLIINNETGELQKLEDYFVIGGSATLDPNYKKNGKMVLNSGDYYTYTSKNILPSKAEISIYWNVLFDLNASRNINTLRDPSLVSEFLYNYERSIQLVNNENKPLMEYRLSNLKWSHEDNELTATLDITQYNENRDTFTHTDTITFPQGDHMEGYGDMYGCSSVITFIFDDDEVEISETGTTNHNTQGDVIYQSTRIPIIADNKKFKFSQKNIEVLLASEWDDLLESVPITTQTVFNAIEYNYTSGGAASYTNMIASPFPLPDKALLFTRRCKDGLIYYYNFNGSNPSIYYVQPSNMYKGGCDLTTEAGTSILTERYAVNPLCMDNGLVRCVFMKNLNRVNIYLYQTPQDNSTIYDPWVLVTSIFVPNMGSVKASIVDDDKITINAGNTTWTLYRGHYHIDVVHTTTDLKLTRRFASIYWTRPDGDTVEENVKDKNVYPFSTNFYHQFYNEKEDMGLMVLRPFKDSVEGKALLRSGKTVLIPYWKVTRERNRPAALALEWMYQYGQSIVAQGT